MAGLNELPRGAAVALRPVPDSQLLATQIRQIPPAPQGTPQPLCAADESDTYYDATITTPITICSLLDASVLDSVFFLRKVKTTRFKLTDPARLQSLASLKSSAVKVAPHICTSSDGPWSAIIISQRRCIGTCSPLNLLFVIGVPNRVVFGWYGSFNAHPPGFEFVGSPIQIDKQSFGQCNGGPTGATGTRKP